MLAQLSRLSSPSLCMCCESSHSCTIPKSEPRRAQGILMLSQPCQTLGTSTEQTVGMAIMSGNVSGGNILSINPDFLRYTSSRRVFHRNWSSRRSTLTSTATRRCVNTASRPTPVESPNPSLQAAGNCSEPACHLHSFLMKSSENWIQRDKTQQVGAKSIFSIENVLRYN